MPLLSRPTFGFAWSPSPMPLRVWLVLVPLIALAGCQSIEDVGHVISGSVSGFRSPAGETNDQRQADNPAKIEGEKSAAAQTFSPPFSLPPKLVGETGSVSEPGDRPQANETDNRRQPPKLESSAIVAVRTTPLSASPAPSDVGQTGSSSEPGDRPQAEEPNDQRQTPPAPEIESETTVAVKTASPPSSLARTEGFVIPDSIIDGDSFRLRGRRIQLHGIDAPELDQICEVKGQKVACGQFSRQALIKLTVGVLVQCDRLDTDPNGYDDSRCSADGLDISSAMVRSGHAVAYRAHSMDYVSDEDRAKGRKFGLWRGTFQMPWQWRAEKGQITQ